MEPTGRWNSKNPLTTSTSAPLINQRVTSEWDAKSDFKWSSVSLRRSTANTHWSL